VFQYSKTLLASQGEGKSLMKMLRLHTVVIEPSQHIFNHHK